MNEWSGKLQAAKELLLSLMGPNGHPRVAGGGVTVVRYEVKGSIKYAEVPELKGMDLESYRSPTRTQVRVTVDK